MKCSPSFSVRFEPLFFQIQRTDSKTSYAEGMKYYLLFSWWSSWGDVLPGYLKVLLDHVTTKVWWWCHRLALLRVSGGSLQPVILVQMTDKTKWGAYISFIGLGITWPQCAVCGPSTVTFPQRTSFVCFLVMMVVSWALGQKYYSISYDLKLAGRYVLVVAAFYALGMSVPSTTCVADGIPHRIDRTFCGYVLRYDLPLVRCRRCCAGARGLVEALPDVPANRVKTGPIRP
jgi:hypothetical protein